VHKVANIAFGSESKAFDLDFGTHRWSGETGLPEGEFPLTAELDGLRYELYSDGTFAEVEL
jgi:hypothetical protein